MEYLRRLAQIESIGNLDPVSSKPYGTTNIRITQLRPELISMYTGMGINVDTADSKQHNDVDPLCIPMIYEYNQLSFIKDGQNLHLIDGYKRMFCIPVTDGIKTVARIYDRRDFNDIELLQFLMKLNYQKLALSGLGSFADRGVTLALNSLFGVDISDILEAIHFYFKGYFDKSEYGSATKIDYSSKSRYNIDNISQVLEVVSSGKFIDDIHSVRWLVKESGLPHPLQLSAILGSNRSEDNTFVFIKSVILDRFNNDQVIISLVEKHNKTNVFDARTFGNSNAILNYFSNLIKSEFRYIEVGKTKEEINYEFEQKLKELKSRGYKKVVDSNKWKLKVGMEVIFAAPPNFSEFRSFKTIKTNGEFFKGKYIKNIPGHLLKTNQLFRFDNGVESISYDYLQIEAEKRELKGTLYSNFKL